MHYNLKLFGCFEDLRHFKVVSVILQHLSKRYPISEIEVARPGHKYTSSTSQDLNHYTNAAPINFGTYRKTAQ